MMTTGALGAMLLEQVAIIPIPEWWPFTGLTIPEDDITGAPPPQPNTVNTVSEQVSSQATVTPTQVAPQPAQAAKPPPPQSDNVVDIFASTPTPAPTTQTSSQPAADMFDFSAD